MKKFFKRTVALMLVLVIVHSASCFAVLAENATGKNNAESEVDMVSQSGLGIIANNLMSAEDNENFSVVSVEVSGKTATVELHNTESCTLVVAVYDEKNEKMLASGIERIGANTDLAEVEIDIKTMPKKFIVKAFLLGSSNNALCKEFISMEYTTAFEEYMQKTPDDYKGEEIIIFDNTEETMDFAVLDDGVISSEKNNSMTFVYDEETKMYTFKNAVDDIKKLKSGDVYYYEYGENSNEFLLFKVKTISVSGSTVEIVQDENIDLKDAFDFVRIDAVSDFSDVEVDENQLGEALTPVGKVPNNGLGVSVAGIAEYKEEYSVNYEISKGGTKVTLKGSLGMTLAFKAKLYYDLSLFGEDYYEFSFEESAKFAFDLSVTGKYVLDKKLMTIPLAKVPVGPFTINVELAPVIEVTASITFHASLEIYDKITADSVNNMKKYRTVTTDTNLSLEAKFELKIGLEITVSVRFVEIVELAVVGEGGGRFVGIIRYDIDVVHPCKTCIDGDCFVYYNIDINFSITIIKDVIDWKWNIAKFKGEAKLFEFYISFPQAGGVVFGKGNCPDIKPKDPDEPSFPDYGLTGNEKVGDIITFGSYPQSQVTDSALISALNKVPKTWKSYRYYDGSMVPGDWMKYADITYDGNKYRAVTFSKYRPYLTIIHNDDITTDQEENGYYKNTIYWFKYEPILWRVLDPKDGFVLCENIIDSQAFNNTVYSYFYKDENCTIFANDYTESSIREWLNGDFYNTAFTSTEKNEIKNSEQYNSDVVWGNSTTYDKIFLLSVDDVFNATYGFLDNFDYDENRVAQGTEYAKCQGLYVDKSSCNYCNGSSQWWLRTPGEYADDVLSMGDCEYGFGRGTPNFTDVGVRPAIKLKTTSNKSVNYVSEETYSNGAVVSDSLFDVSKDSCIAGNKYILMNVIGYKSGFEVSEENLYFINQLTADHKGKINTQFIPKVSDTDSTTLLIGDFGRGVEVKFVVPDNLGEKFTDLRLLNATAYKKGNDITVFASADADRMAVYSTTFSGQTVLVETLNTPITFSSSKAYVLKFTDWHKNGNEVKTTITTGDNKYNLRFVFNVDNEGHEYNSVITEPTNSLQGYTTYTCSICGESYKADYVPALGKLEKVSISDFEINYKMVVKLKPNVKLSVDIDYEAEYSSSDESVVSVDKDGNVTATGTGEAEITVTITDEYGNVVEDTCKVTVSYSWWQWIIIIFLFGWIWY